MGTPLTRRPKPEVAQTFCIVALFPLPSAMRISCQLATNRNDLKTYLLPSRSEISKIKPKRTQAICFEGLLMIVHPFCTQFCHMLTNYRNLVLEQHFYTFAGFRCHETSPFGIEFPSEFHIFRGTPSEHHFRQLYST